MARQFVAGIGRHHAILASGAFAVALATGWFGGSTPLALPHFVALLGLLVLLAVRIAGRLGSATVPNEPEPALDVAPAARSARRDDIELGLLLVVTLHVLFQMTGGPDSPLYPLTYVFVAFAAAFTELWAGRILILSTLLAEGLAVVASGMAGRALELAPWHAGFVILFSLSWSGFLRAQILYHRREQQQTLRRAKAEISAFARDVRLITSPLSRESRVRSREEEQQAQLTDAVESIRRTVRLLLQAFKDAYGLNSCALYWLDDRGRLQVRELVTSSDLFDSRPLDQGEGLPGTVVQTRQPVRMKGLKRDQASLCYYRPGEQVAAFLGVPVMQGRMVRGVLIADRRQTLPFTERNEAVFVAAAEQIQRTVDNERIFLETEAAKDAQEGFHRAVKALNSVQDQSAVHEAALNAVREVARFDFAALAVYDEATRSHLVVRAEGPGRERYQGLTFPDNSGLASQVVKTNHALPHGARLKEREAVVFTKETRLRNLKSLLVLPVSFGERVVATLTLGTKAEHAYPLEVRDRLEVVASSAAVSMVNAANFEKVVDLAITDPLTGLANRRHFLARLVEMLAFARRAKRPMSLILCDLDHFKRVNDSHGHPAGDALLVRVAQTLGDCVRQVDVVGRHGGEEFAILLEGADEEGGRHMAERMRAAVAEQIIPIDGATLRATMSLGVVTWDGEEADAKSLFDAADRALYRAKETGRNRAVHTSDMSPVANSEAKG